MNSKNSIQTNEYSSNLVEVLLDKMNNHELEIIQLVQMVRMLVPSQEPERFYSREKTAEILDISIEQLDLLRKKGKINCRKVERSIKYSKGDIIEFQEKCKIR